MRIDRLKIFLDSMVGGAWSFLVGGVICLVNSVNERDLSLLNSWVNTFENSFELFRELANFLEGLLVFSQRKFEAITGL